MADYIERERLKEAFNADLQTLQTVDEHTMNLILMDIDEAPAADVAPVVHGHWVEVTDEVQDILKERPPYVMLRAYKCSLCGRYETKMEPYCNCGAKMDGGK